MSSGNKRKIIKPGHGPVEVAVKPRMDLGGQDRTVKTTIQDGKITDIQELPSPILKMDEGGRYRLRHDGRMFVVERSGPGPLRMAHDKRWHVVGNYPRLTEAEKFFEFITRR